MAGVEPGNGTGYRLQSIEARLKRIEDLEPAVLKSQLADLREDLHQVAAEVSATRKVLTGFLVTFAFTGITVIISVFAITQGH